MTRRQDGSKRKGVIVIKNGKAVKMALSLDQSRRYAWAKFFAMERERDQLLILNGVLEERIAELSVMITTSEPLQVLDPDGDLMAQARALLGTLSRQARGIEALARAAQRMADRQVSP